VHRHTRAVEEALLARPALVAAGARAAGGAVLDVVCPCGAAVVGVYGWRFRREGCCWRLIIGLLRWALGGIIVGLRGLVVVVVVIASQLLLLLRTARLSIRQLLLTNYWIPRSCTGG